ncbi:MAG: DUF721 domain-containing protein [Phycisphaerales bacterium]|nr:DUF721 domain-containing protein [Phycisphaerales bacterium]
MDHPDWDQLGRVRRTRVRESPSGDLRRLFLAQAPELRRLRRQLAGIAASWAETIPPEIAARTRLEGISRGVLRVGVPDSAAAYELDRVLRSGAEAVVLRGGGAGVRSVRVVVSSELGSGPMS